jgi:osmotically-inducible protein OsmY
VTSLNLDSSFLRARKLFCATIALCIGACATIAPRSAAERAADAVIATHVQEALMRSPYLYAKHIDVKVDRGVVHLDGLIWLNDDFRDTRRITKSVPGVSEVVLELDLERGGRR